MMDENGGKTHWTRKTIHDLLTQPIGTVWTILVEDHPGIIPVEFGQIPISSLGEEVVLSFPNIIHCKVVTLRGKVNFDLCIIWTTLVEDI